MEYLANKYGILTNITVRPYCDMVSHKEPRKEVLMFLSDVKKHLQTLMDLYFVLDGCNASVNRVSKWSVDASIYLSCLSFNVPIDGTSFPSIENRIKWLHDRTCALILLSRTPNVKKLNAPRGRKAWDEPTLKRYEDAKTNFVAAWCYLRACFSLDDAEKSVPPVIWKKWIEKCNSLFLGDYE